MPRMYSVAQQRVKRRIEAARNCSDVDHKVERLMGALNQAAVVRLPDQDIEKLNVYLQEQNGVAEARKERFPTPPPPGRNTPGLTEATMRRPDDFEIEGEDIEYFDGDEANEAATKLQSAHRGKRARARVEGMKKTKQENAAATKVQSVYRGKQTRQKLQDGSYFDVPGEGEGDQQDSTQPEEDAELNNAATKVQTAFRGKQARDQVNAIKEEKAVMKEMNAAATKVQSVYRGRLARQNLAAAYAEGYGELMHGMMDPNAEGFVGDGDAEGYEGQEGYYEGQDGEYLPEGYYEGQEGEYLAEGYGEEGYDEGQEGYYEGEPGEDGYVPAGGEYDEAGDY